MLGTIRETIDNLPEQSFHQYFIEYMMKVQDSNIEAEFKHMIHHNDVTVLNIGNLIQTTYEGLVDICSTPKSCNLLI